MFHISVSCWAYIKKITESYDSLLTALPEPGCKSNGCSPEVLKITNGGSYEVMKTPPVVLISGLAQEVNIWSTCFISLMSFV